MTDQAQDRAAEGGGEHQQAIDAILKRAVHDRDFRSQLLTDPRKAIQGAYGVTIPPTFRIRFMEKDTDLDALVVLPDFHPADGALSDDQLEHVAGGMHQDASWSRHIAQSRD